MHAVPPSMTGNYMPHKYDFGIDESKFTYGPKQSTPSESDAKTSDLDSCESSSSVETLEMCLHQLNLNPKLLMNLKSGLMLLSLRSLGYGFTKKACFACGSFSHLIRDCDFHEKRMAKQIKLNKQKGKSTGPMENRLVWNNVQRLNHQNKFVPTAVLTKTGRFPVNADRQNFTCQATSTSTARKVNTARPKVNEIRPSHNVYKSHSPIRRPFNRTTTPKLNFVQHKVNTARDKSISALGGKWETAVKASADYQDFNGGPVAFGRSKGQITGIKGEYSNARTPQQNRVAERKNNTLIEATRTMLADLFLPNTFWAEAVSTACYVLNRVLVTKPQNKTPYELLTGKFAKKFDEGFLVGYFLNSKAFRPITAENKANYTAGPKEANNSADWDDPQKALKNKEIVDSGCSRYITGKKAYLVDYQDYNGGHVTFGGLIS
nr:hypothetical protein [Tanacetum cinerariifolium]